MYCLAVLSAVLVYKDEDIPLQSAALCRLRYEQRSHADRLRNYRTENPYVEQGISQRPSEPRGKPIEPERTDLRCSVLREGHQL